MVSNDLDTDLRAVAQHLDGGDLAGAIRGLRDVTGRAPLEALAPLVGRSARIAGFAELEKAARKVARRPRDATALHAFGYACVERGISWLAVPALQAALRSAPGHRGILLELVVALENEDRHAEAAQVLRDHDEVLEPWPDRYLLVLNTLLAGDGAGAAREAGALPAPRDTDWATAHERVQAMLARHRAAAAVTALDRQDVRGWHFVLNAGLLTTLSPYGFEVMTGRYAFVHDSYDLCLRGLLRLRDVLAATGRTPARVALLPDRSSAVLGLAAARLLGVPAEPGGVDRVDTLVVAYDLDEVDPGLVLQLRHRPPGQVLLEHASCWTSPPPIAADVTTLLHQVVVPPWGERLTGGDGTPRRLPADDGPVAELAERVLAADGSDDAGDGTTPADPDDAFATTAGALAPLWAAGGRDRDRVWSPGPVSSNRFR